MNKPAPGVSHLIGRKFGLVEHGRTLAINHGQK